MTQETNKRQERKQMGELLQSHYKDLVAIHNQRREMTVRDKIQEMVQGYVIEPESSLDRVLSPYKFEKSLPEQIREEASKVRVEIRYPDSLYGI